MEMPRNALNELKELREAVNQSSEHTLRQLQCIESNNMLLGSLMSIILALGVSIQLKILVYWVPAAFLLIPLWILYSTINTIYRIFKTPASLFQQFNSNQASNNSILFIKNKLYVYLSVIHKRMYSAIKGISLINTITLLILVLIADKSIILNSSPSLVIPSLVALIYAFSPLFFTDFSILFITNESDESKFENWQEDNEKQSIKAVGKKLFVTVVVIVIILMLMILALLQSWAMVENIWFLLIVFVLQFVFLVMVASYYSSMSIRRELTNSITNFADLNYLINEAVLSDNFSSDTVAELKKLYLTAKQYDLVIDDSFKFIYFNTFAPNRVYFKRK